MSEGGGCVVGVDVSGTVGVGVSVGSGVKLGVEVRGTNGVGLDVGVGEGVAVIGGVTGSVADGEAEMSGVGVTVGRPDGLARIWRIPAQ